MYVEHMLAGSVVRLVRTNSEDGVVWTWKEVDQETTIKRAEILLVSLDMLAPGSIEMEVVQCIISPPSSSFGIGASGEFRACFTPHLYIVHYDEV